MSDAARESIQIWSEGSRLRADLYLPAGGASAAPAILLCNGWGGHGRFLASLAHAFAEGGYAVLDCDYRGWGGSDGKIIPLAETSSLIDAGPQTLRAIVLRELVDPFDQVVDLRNCLAFLMAIRASTPHRSRFGARVSARAMR